MSPDERIKALLEDTRISGYFQTDLFHKSYYTYFSKKSKKWIAGEISEPRLQLSH